MMSSHEIPEIALVGCPNCGKTALFNALTGATQKVANYPGVTVERKKGFLKTSEALFRIVDLPGTYSLRGRSPDEEITRDVILGRVQGEPLPAAIVCVADATNLRLVLRLILELKRLGRPMVLALNMVDIAERQGSRVDKERLASELGIPVVSTVAVRKNGAETLVQAIKALVKNPAKEKPEWSEPSSDDIRKAHAEAERILKTCLYRPGNDRVTRTIDHVLLHPIFGLAILAILLFVVFQAVFTWATPATEGIKSLFDSLSDFINAQMPDGMLRSLLTMGIIAGVGNVIVFLPQILILFFFIIVLEDSGYMARAAFLMDRLMARAGLHGRAFIPLLSSFACAIPGVMATRVIENKRDRLTTIMVTPLMTCSARIPVYALLIAAFIPNKTVWGMNLQGVVMFGAYATGIISALVVAWIMKKLVWRQRAEPFMMEMPGYKWPHPRNIIMGLWQRAMIFMRRAGTIIMAMMIVIWFLCSFPAPPDGTTGPAINTSLAGTLGHALEPILRPVGFNWQIAVALIPGMAAREVAVGALGTVYALTETGDAAEQALQSTLAASWPLSTGLALLAWYIFAPQCISTLAVVKRETNSWKWPIIMFVYMMVLAYAAAFVTFHLAKSWGAS